MLLFRLSIVLLMFVPNVSAQLFYFQDVETTLVKTTDQSPAHWYIEIFSNSTVDTLLTWEANFSTIPSEWTINLDCQDPNGNWFPVVNDGDAEDFILLSSPDFPQKLIIGAMFNDVPGIGSVYFDIYDKEYPAYAVEIAYHFVVTQGTASLESLSNTDFQLGEGQLTILRDEAVEVTILDASGRLILQTDSEKNIPLEQYSNQLLLIQLKLGQRTHLIKVIP